MGDERDGRDARGGVRGERRGNGPRHVPVLIDRRVLHAEGLEFADEEAEQIELFLGARVALGVLLRLRVDLDVAQETIQDGFFGRVECHGNSSICGLGHGAKTVYDESENKCEGFLIID